MSILVSPSYSLSQILKENIKIGFLIRDKDDLAIQETAQLAVDQANAQGGYKERKFELVTKSCEGPWGITSKQAVDLIFEDQVCIIVTALNGRNAHLVEQVIAKSHIVMLSTLSSDPTLSKAYVPWYFRINPDDRQQAKVLAKDIYVTNHAKKVAVVSLDDYDGKKSAEAFVAEAQAKGYPEPIVYSDISNQKDLEKINEYLWDAIVFSGALKDTTFMDKISQMKNAYAFLNFFNFLKNGEQADNIQTYFAPSLDFVYDGISMAIESIRKYGPDSEGIRTGFRDLNYAGLTGKIEFDNLGNRLIE